jgi:hypothetical protein
MTRAGALSCDAADLPDRRSAPPDRRLLSATSGNGPAGPGRARRAQGRGARTLTERPIIGQNRDLFGLSSSAGTVGSGGGAGTGGAAGGTAGARTIVKVLDVTDVWSGHPVGSA